MNYLKAVSRKKAGEFNIFRKIIQSYLCGCMYRAKESEGHTFPELE